MVAGAAADTATSAPQQGSAAPQNSAAYWSARKLIRTAELQIEVGDVRKALALLDSIAKQSGGMVTESHSSRDMDDARRAQIVIRIPSDRLDGTLSSLHGLGDIKSESVSAQDVTKEYADLETRLAVKEQTVTRIRALLDSHTAKLTDVLEVERELAREIAELEEMKGSRRYYDQQIALSTIKIELVDHSSVGGSKFASNIGDAMRHSLDVLGTSLSSLIYIVVFLLPWVLFAIPVWYLVRWARERRSRKQG